MSRHYHDKRNYRKSGTVPKSQINATCLIWKSMMIVKISFRKLGRTAPSGKKWLPESVKLLPDYG